MSEYIIPRKVPRKLPKSTRSPLVPRKLFSSPEKNSPLVPRKLFSSPQSPLVPRKLFSSPPTVKRKLFGSPLVPRKLFSSPKKNSPLVPKRLFSSPEITRKLATSSRSIARRLFTTPPKPSSPGHSTIREKLSLLTPTSVPAKPTERQLSYILSDYDDYKSSGKKSIALQKYWESIFPNFVSDEQKIKKQQLEELFTEGVQVTPSMKTPFPAIFNGLVKEVNQKNNLFIDPIINERNRDLETDTYYKYIQNVNKLSNSIKIGNIGTIIFDRSDTSIQVGQPYIQNIYWNFVPSSTYVDYNTLSRNLRGSLKKDIDTHVHIMFGKGFDRNYTKSMNVLKVHVSMYFHWINGTTTALRCGKDLRSKAGSGNYRGGTRNIWEENTYLLKNNLSSSRNILDFIYRNVCSTFDLNPNTHFGKGTHFGKSKITLRSVQSDIKYLK
jgi:hypothetical protein